MSLKARQARYALKGREWASEAWERLRKPMVESLRVYNGNLGDGPMASTMEEGTWLAEVFGIDLKAM